MTTIPEIEARATRKAVLYRMVMPGHVCPFGLKSKSLLERNGYEVEDHFLRTREEVDAFKARHGVETTPQTFIDGERIGGHSELRAWFGKPLPAKDALTYRPVIVLFALAALMALAARWVVGDAGFATWLQWTIAFAMCLLGFQKLQDVESFSSSFLNYDLLAKRWVPYAYIYPFAETGAGLLMITGVLSWVSIPVALFIGIVGAVSVFQAVYVEKRELKCACVGGNSNVPLGFVSLLENLMMVFMALWMLSMV
ncbi:MauE/DoxX family redox-associated membrane protein [Falsirhodobacter halotolerans]|uniref:MauE/DoxX family redox-associated membrane protein n=1 Tax=Falsirhodobacter halotolerans TaxID=1146892 RepID=UPI001FD45833|nr:MauE/DoxX family redox-associated membrane protein [Falsirhodobacter halotolerans]MCJ8140161.1 glutaredoxin [Falsirhodobacter halotolerans]